MLVEVPRWENIKVEVCSRSTHPTYGSARREPPREGLTRVDSERRIPDSPSPGHRRRYLAFRPEYLPA